VCEPPPRAYNIIFHMTILFRFLPSSSFNVTVDACFFTTIYRVRQANFLFSYGISYSKKEVSLPHPVYL
jgi:hypothetical protein